MTDTLVSTQAPWVPPVNTTAGAMPPVQARQQQEEPARKLGPNLKRRIIIIVAGAVVAAAALFGILHWRSGEKAGTYRMTGVELGDVTATVSATGTLQAIRSVKVGTQVSGQISEIHADFNDHVKKGQLIARIDSTLLRQEVRGATAAVAHSQANLVEARTEYGRDSTLATAGYIPMSDYDLGRQKYALARADLQSSRVQLDRARGNLAYAAIKSPIDGVVVERNVDVGQTVAASLSAPQLFLIAEDLSKLQILASVDESDISQIRQGQPVTFTVQSQRGHPLKGTVQQVRLQSTTEQNVVNYTVVVSTGNPDGSLLPGMTATVAFEIAHAVNVTRVASSALRLQPTAAMLAQFPVAETQDTAGRSPGVAAHSAQGASGGRRSGGAARSGTGRLWYLDEHGKPAAMQVRTGITDGKYTEVSGPQVHVGLQVIAAVAGAASSASASPFQSQQSQQRQPGGSGQRPGP